MSASDREVRDEVEEALREVRARARQDSEPRAPLPERPEPSTTPRPLSKLDGVDDQSPPSPSPDREDLNRAWDVSEGGGGGLLRAVMRRVGRLLAGGVVERQVRMNSLQVRFDNEVVRYVDERVDRMSRHYDRILGLHGRRMEEIDERHLILQQELVRHVHDLVERIDFVFESGEQNHLYLEGMLRELREELKRLADRLAALPGEKR